MDNWQKEFKEGFQCNARKQGRKYGNNSEESQIKMTIIKRDKKNTRNKEDQIAVALNRKAVFDVLGNSRYVDIVVSSNLETIFISGAHITQIIKKPRYSGCYVLHERKQRTDDQFVYSTTSTDLYRKIVEAYKNNIVFPVNNTWVHPEMVCEGVLAIRGTKLYSEEDFKCQ